MEEEELRDGGAMLVTKGEEDGGRMALASWVAGTLDFMAIKSLSFFDRGAAEDEEAAC